MRSREIATRHTRIRAVSNRVGSAPAALEPTYDANVSAIRVSPYIALISSSPNSEHFTRVAPSIRRAKS